VALGTLLVDVLGPLAALLGVVEAASENVVRSETGCPSSLTTWKETV
jgi:hypothetical protein